MAAPYNKTRDPVHAWHAARIAHARGQAPRPEFDDPRWNGPYGPTFGRVGEDGFEYAWTFLERACVVEGRVTTTDGKFSAEVRYELVEGSYRLRHLSITASADDDITNRTTQSVRPSALRGELEEAVETRLQDIRIFEPTPGAHVWFDPETFEFRDTNAREHIPTVGNVVTRDSRVLSVPAARRGRRVNDAYEVEEDWAIVAFVQLEYANRGSLRPNGDAARDSRLKGRYNASQIAHIMKQARRRGLVSAGTRGHTVGGELTAQGQMRFEGAVERNVGGSHDNLGET